MTKQNCWEAKRCGREPGGARVAELGVCPAAAATATDGMNDGKNGGRVCWAVSGTFCGGQVQGTFAMKLVNCMTCEFYQRVMKEEGPNYRKSSEVLARLAVH
jgi:hypothetical protein